MTTHRKITVSAWSPAQTPVVQPARPGRRFWPPGVIGLIGTILLHTFAIQTVLLGTRAHRTTLPEIPQPGAAINRSSAKPADSLVFLDLPSPATTDPGSVQVTTSVQAALAANPLVIAVADFAPAVRLEVLALNDVQESESSADSGDGAEHARLLGIYSGQIRARIERIWTRPLTPVNSSSGTAKSAGAADYFHCQAQIVQDSIGNVQEILLPNCNGTVAWQRSLVMAIQQASPLPAPPKPSVFSYTVSLNFFGYPHVAGGPDDGYESAQVETAQVASPPTMREPPIHPPAPPDVSPATDGPDGAQ